MEKYIIEYELYDDILDLLGHEIPHSNLENVKTVVVELTEEEYEALVGAGINIVPNTPCEMLFLPSYISATPTTTLPTEIQTYLKADAAHLAGFTGAGVNIALLDTGCNDTAAAAIPGVIRQTYVDGQNIHVDNYLHGSYGALLIAQTKKLADGSTFHGGIAPGCQLYTMNVFDGGVASIITAIDWCITNNIHVMNFSLSTVGLTTSINAALAAGIIVCCASGNSNISNMAHPANVPGVIAVNAVSSSDLPATFNIFGSHITLDGNTQITTVFHNLGGAEIRVGGTSQACHMTSAMMALYKQKYPSLNSAKAINLLRRKALHLDGYTYDIASPTQDVLLDYTTGAGFTSPLY